MNRLGMIVDLAHVSDKTFYDALAVTYKPVIVSHSSMRAISNVPRNVTDDMLRALAKNGGVLGICFGMGFIKSTGRASFAVGHQHPSGGSGADWQGAGRVRGGECAKAVREAVRLLPAPAMVRRKLTELRSERHKLARPPSYKVRGWTR